MKKTHYRHVLTVFLVCLLVVSIASSATISIEPPATTISPGATTNITLMLDSAPNGLAGYSLNLVLSNPDIAVFDNVSFPSWATLNNVTYPSPGTVRISGVDIGRVILPGSADIALGTVTIRGTGPGFTTISINSVRMDAQGGSSISPAVRTGQLTIPGGTSTGGVSSGGSGYSGGGGSYAGGGGGQSYSTSPTDIEPVVTVLATTGAIPATVTTPDIPVYSGSVTAQIPTTPAYTPLPVTPAATTPVTKLPGGSPAAVPWITIIGIIIVIGIISAALVIYYLKKAGLI